MKKITLILTIGVVAAFIVILLLIHQTITTFRSPIGTSTPNVSAEIGQTLMIGISSTTLTEADRSVIETVHPGGIILFSRNIRTQAQTAKLIADLQSLDATYSSSSLFISIDEEGGAVSRLPWISVKAGEPAITTTSSASQVAVARAMALRAIGANVDLAPVLDAATSGDFLYDRTFQTSYELSGNLGAAMIRGYEANDILATMKHFPGYAGIAADPEKQLYRIAIPETRQFTIAAAADPAFVMVSNVIYPALDPVNPCPLSAACISYLHAKVPGQYLVMSDDLSDPVMRDNYNIGSEAVQAMRAGVDIELVASGIPADAIAAYDALADAVKNNVISPQIITDEYNKIAIVKSHF